jgi:hypothetical protein
MLAFAPPSQGPRTGQDKTGTDRRRRGGGPFLRRNMRSPGTWTLNQQFDCISPVAGNGVVTLSASGPLTSSYTVHGMYEPPWHVGLSTATQEHYSTIQYCNYCTVQETKERKITPIEWSMCCIALVTFWVIPRPCVTVRSRFGYDPQRRNRKKVCCSLWA